MKQEIPLVESQYSMILTAMNFYRESLIETKKKVFDISLNKIKEKNPIVFLDGMEMICVTKALLEYARHLDCMNHFLEAKPYYQESEKMDKLRIYFQKTNGPKVKNENRKEKLTKLVEELQSKGINIGFASRLPIIYHAH